MLGYRNIDRSSSHCLAFVEANEIDADLPALVAKIRASGFRIAYLDCAQYMERPWEMATAIGCALQTDHPPYHVGTQTQWVRWLDDLISLANRAPGLVIVLDNADQMFLAHRHHITEMIEAYLIQFHHWFERDLPCHFYVQMSAHPAVATSFGPMELSTRNAI